MKNPPRVLIAKVGLDGHDVGAKVVCRALMEAGMEVIYTGLRQSPEAIVQTALQEDVEVLGLSIMSGAHLPLCRKVAGELERVGLLGEIRWIVGGNIPSRDHEELERLGVEGVFGVGASFESIVDLIREGS